MLVLVVLLALDPLSADDPGLQLSFAAVAGLLTIGPPLAVWLRGFMPGRIADLLAQSGAAGLATAPVLASGFGQISTVGLVANLVAARGQGRSWLLRCSEPWPIRYGDLRGWGWRGSQPWGPAS